MKRWVVCGLMLVGSLAKERPAFAADVDWLGPPGCVDPRGTREEAERLLGRPLTSVKAVDFQVRIVDRASKWTLTLSTIDRATGERRDRVLEGKSCDDVTAAAAVALAMVVNAEDDPETAATSEPEPQIEPETPAQEASSTQSVRPTPSVPRSAGVEPRELGLAMSVAALGDVGALPNAAGGGEIAGSLDYGALRVTALGALMVGADEQSSGRGAEFDLTIAALLACARRALGPALASLCLGIEAGRLAGRGTGVADPRTGESFWWAPSVAAGLHVSVSGDFGIFARIGATSPRVRRDFVLNDTQLVHRPAAITGRSTIGVELKLE